MKLQLEWHRPLKLKTDNPSLIYSVDYKNLPKSAGIYVFARKHGRKTEALYVGKAQSLYSRVRGQQNNLPLMLHIQKAKTGERVLIYARFVARSGQQQAKCLPIIEKALIRYFLSKGHDLVNIQGTLLRRHEITSRGGPAAIPDLMFVDRAKSE